MARWDGPAFIEVLGDVTGLDVLYSVLTLMHVEDKLSALRNMVTSLRPGGKLVLSIADVDAVLDYGAWLVQLFPSP